MDDEDEVRIAPDPSLRLLASVIDGLSATWIAHGNEDGSISIRKPKSRAKGSDSE
jgi:hypothetical protein